jgi:hypothetical protein
MVRPSNASRLWTTVFQERLVVRPAGSQTKRPGASAKIRPNSRPLSASACPVVKVTDSPSPPDTFSAVLNSRTVVVLPGPRSPAIRREDPPSWARA